MKCWTTHLAAFVLLVSGTLFGADQTIDAEAIAARFLNSVVVLRTSDSSHQNDRLGTGFVVSNDGFVVSNFHVVEGATQILAQTTEGTEIPILGIHRLNRERDIVVLRAEIGRGRSIPMQPVLPATGSPVVVIGSPKGLQGSVTNGIVSAIRDVDGDTLIQISAPISAGSSGSPVIDRSGRVVGVATSKMIDGELLNFAVPIGVVTELLGGSGTTRSGVSRMDDEVLYVPEKSQSTDAKQDSALLNSPEYSAFKTLEARGDAPKMTELAMGFVKSYPRSAVALRALSDANFYLGMSDEAMRHAKRALDLDAGSPRGWDNLGVLYADAGLSDLAVQAFREGLRLAPTDVKLWIDLAGAAFSANRAEAIRALRNAEDAFVGFVPDVEVSVYPLARQLARAFYDVGAFESALQWAAKATDANASDGRAWLLRARAARELGRYADVKEFLRRANELDLPNKWLLYLILADSQEMAGDTEAALSTLQFGLGLFPRERELLATFSYIAARNVMSRTRGQFSAADINEIHKALRTLQDVDSAMYDEVLGNVKRILNVP